MNIKKYFFIPLIIFISGCCSFQLVQSSFNDKIVIDGINKEWGSTLKNIEGKNISFGFANNKDFLYVSLITNDRNIIKKIIMNGMILWLESSEGELGIKYPFRMETSELRIMRMEESDQRQRREPGAMMDLLKGREDMQVINKEDLPLYTYNAGAGQNYKAKIKMDKDIFVYEMQIPLKDDISKRVFGNNVKEVKVNFKTGEMDRDEMRGNNNQGMQNGGGRGGRGGGGMKNQVGMHPPREKMDFSPMDYSFKVELK